MDLVALEVALSHTSLSATTRTQVSRCARNCSDLRLMGAGNYANEYAANVLQPKGEQSASWDFGLSAYSNKVKKH